MVITEADLRQRLPRPVSGARLEVPGGVRLTPSARDFVNQWKLVLVDESAPTPSMEQGHTPSRGWDTPSVFPVRLQGEAPRCQTCGGQVSDKPDGLTQLNAFHFAPKTHPRIRLRGKVDSLNALVLMAGHHAEAAGRADLAAHLATLAAYVREVMSAEYNERPVAPLELPGVTEAEMHRATHDPEGVLGIPHLTIDASAPELMHWLNLARTSARELEVELLTVFHDPHDAAGASLGHALNRLSSAFYYCQLLLGGGHPR